MKPLAIVPLSVLLRGMLWKSYKLKLPTSVKESLKSLPLKNTAMQILMLMNVVCMKTKPMGFV